MTDQRIKDLVYYMRDELKQSGLITREEWSEIMSWHKGAARRLEAYDDLQKKLSDAELCVDAVNEIRTTLLRENVPTAAFVDDHVRNAIAERNQLLDALQIVANAIEEKERREYLREPDWNPEAHCEPITLQVKDARRIFDLLEGKYDGASMIELKNQ